GRCPGVYGRWARDVVRIGCAGLRFALRGIRTHGPWYADADGGGQRHARRGSSPARSASFHRCPRNAFAWAISGRAVSAFLVSAISFSKYSVAFGRSPATSAARAAP